MVASAFSWQQVSVNLFQCFSLESINSYIVSFFTLFECSGPQDIPYVYCLFYVFFVPLRWIYYKFKKWHYYLLVIIPDASTATYLIFLLFNNVLCYCWLNASNCFRIFATMQIQFSWLIFFSIRGTKSFSWFAFLLPRGH